jgi:SagB-type dehydrogenase family enzyme
VKALHAKAGFASAVYGRVGPDPLDPAEEFHEASKLYPSFIARQSIGVLRLAVEPALQAATLRAGKRNRHLPVQSLPEPAYPTMRLADAIRTRRSARSFDPGRPVTLTSLATLLDAAYGVTGAFAGDEESPALRAVPSGGALYPLEVYVLAAHVEDIEEGLYHFVPLRRTLERLPADDPQARLRSALTYPEVFDGSAVTLLVTAMFWRTRFKYGPRGYRFALLEAGHLMQNLLLVATALGLGSVPIGGLFDRRADELLGVDGVNESVLYAAHVGPVEQA